MPLLARVGCAFICALWLAAGSLGHDPWKSDDAINLGVAWGVAQGSWLVPRLAGEAWLTSPPLFHWLTALCGQLFTGLLAWHDAARMASVIFGAAFLGALSLIAHRIAGASAGLAAPLLAIGTLGFLVPLHDAQPLAAGLAGWAIALLGLARWRTSPILPGSLYGIGIGIGFLSAGLLGAGLPIVSGLLLLIHPNWRGRPNLLAWLTSAFVAVAIILPWPMLLHQRGPELFDYWWALQLTHRPLSDAFSHDHLQLLAWAGWPVFPLALWNLWLERRRIWQAPTILPLSASLVTLAVFAVSEPTPTSLLPALLPLTLLAAAGAGRLRRGAANAFDWFGMMTFTLLASLIWLGGIAILTGEPQRVAKNFTIPAPDFVPQVSIPNVALAIAVSVAWIAVLLKTPRSPWRAAARWSIGLTTTWILLTTLWFPWIDHIKTYRQVSTDLRRAMEVKGKNTSDVSNFSGCIEREGLGPAHRASFDYFDGIRTISSSATSRCRFLIVQTNPEAEKEKSGWHLVLETARPADKSERIRLYRRY